MLGISIQGELWVTEGDNLDYGVVGWEEDLQLGRQTDIDS
jgi:hypothetical protein